jgi:hypothetical protein
MKWEREHDQVSERICVVALVVAVATLVILMTVTFTSTY